LEQIQQIRLNREGDAWHCFVMLAAALRCFGQKLATASRSGKAYLR
jgi:hypothetical protein